MDVVTLPLIGHAASVVEAIEQMRKQQRAGVVVHREDDTHALLYAGDLFQARDSEIRSVGEVPDAEPVMLLDLKRARKFGVDIVRPHRTAADYTEMLRAEGVDYSIVGASYDTAMVVTRSEEMTSMLSTTGVYRCTGVSRHYFPKPRVSPGQKCLRPHCLASNGDRSIIEPA